MEEGKRQKQVGVLVQQELGDIFQRMGLSMTEGGMISISAVKLTPDLLEARIYLSFFQIKDPEAMLKKVEERSHEIKRQLASRVKHQLRRIPVLQYFIDDTLDHAFKMDELFRKLNAEKPIIKAEEPVRTEDKQPVIEEEKPSPAPKKPAATAKKPATVTSKKSGTPKKPVEAAKKTAAAPKKPATAAKKSAAAKSATPAKSAAAKKPSARTKKSPEQE